MVALEDSGFILARGDRRDFVVIDQAGGYHALSKRITGVAAKMIRERLRDIDPLRLPSVEEAKAFQERRSFLGEEKENMAAKYDDLKQEAAQRAQKQEEERIKAAQKEEEQRKEAIQKDEDRRREAIGKEEEERKQAIADEERKREEAFQKEAKEQAEKQVEQLREMERQEQFREAYKDHMQRQFEEAMLEQQRHRQEEAERARAPYINNAHSRYGIALSQHYNVKDHYGSLARSAMAEYGAFIRDRENLNRKIATAKDPTERKSLELRREIEYAEYMAITSDRIAVQSEVIVGRADTDEAKLQRERATSHRVRAQELRKEFQELYRAPEERADVTKPAPAQQQREKEGSSRPPLMVEERTPETRHDPPQKLGDFVRDLPTPEQRESSKVLGKNANRDPASRRAHAEALGAERKREKALDSITKDIKGKRNLRAADIRNLNRQDVEGIRTKGDDYLRTLTAERERDRGKGLER